MVAKLLTLLLLLSSIHAIGQRNIIEVPTTEIVEYGKLFFQEQGVMTKDGFNSSTVTTYGLGGNVEVGLAINQLVFQRSKGVEIDPGKPGES